MRHLQALGAEVDTDVLHSLYEGLEESLDAAVDGLITPAFMDQCFPKIEDQVASLMGARQERAEERSGPDLDEEDLEQMNEAEEAEAELLQQVVAAIGGFLKCLGDVALPRVEALVQKYFNPLLAQAARGHEDRWVALLVISDCLEYAPGSQKHLPALLPELVKHAQSDSHDVANVCIYTLGVIAEKYPAVRPPPARAAEQVDQTHAVHCDVLLNGPMPCASGHCTVTLARCMCVLHVRWGARYQHVESCTAHEFGPLSGRASGQTTMHYNLWRGGVPCRNGRWSVCAGVRAASR